jgi:receptor protein-tyrosine kinase
MKNIERLFQDDRPVPGLRPSGRVSTAPIDDAEPKAASADVNFVADFSRLNPGRAPGANGTGPAQGVVMDAEVDDAEDAQEAARAYPLTYVEPIRVKPGPALFSAHNPGHPHSENIRLLRTEILLRHTARDRGMAFAVLSAGQGEGRSRLAAELALAFAQLGRSTLLLDADMRNPHLHKLFGAGQHNGLAQAITGSSAPGFLGVEGYPSLSLMTSGTSTTTNPLELLSDGRFESFMSELRDTFDFIIVDTPRSADFADALVIATVVGHVLTVHRAKHTRVKAASTMFKQLASARAEILGGVLNKF